LVLVLWIISSVFLKPEIVCIPSFFIEKYKNSVKNKRLKSLVATLHQRKKRNRGMLPVLVLTEKVSEKTEGTVKIRDPIR
jgi:hypothetical protein